MPVALMHVRIGADNSDGAIHETRYGSVEEFRHFGGVLLQR